MEFVITIFLTLFGILLLYIGFPTLLNYRMRKHFLKNRPQTNHIYLTFDDGPDPLATPLILDALRAHQAKATFFLQGNQLRQHVTLVNRMIKEGHQIAEHSFLHSHPWKTNPLTSLKDLMVGEYCIRPFLDPQSRRWFRPPFGKFNLITLLYIILKKKRLAFWHIDAKDYQQYNSQMLARQLLIQFFPGAIVLLHDHHRQKNSDPMITVETVRVVLKEGAQQGYHFETLDRLPLEVNAHPIKQEHSKHD